MNAQAISYMTKKEGNFTGADAVIAALLAQEVDYIFGMVGGMIMPVYDALYKSGAPHHIMVGHEQGAAHMADGYARITGKPGVVMTTSGPGATNLVTGLANAMMDSIPMVAITGQVNSTMLGNDAFQEADMSGITMPITKHNYQVASADELPEVIAEAFYLAMSGRPGPVLIDLPRDVAVSPCRRVVAPPKAPQGYKDPYGVKPSQIAQALELLKKAHRPVILAGGGVILADACAELMALAEKLEMPVSSTLMGLGNFPAKHRLHLGMPGMHGTPQANLAIFNSDLLFCVGTRLDDRVTGVAKRFAPQADIIHIDVDESEINKILPSAVGIVGHAKPALKALLAGVADWPSTPERKLWHDRIAEFKAKHPMGYIKKDDVMAPQEVIEAVAEAVDEDAVVATGVGQHQMFTAQYYPFQKPRSLITSGGLGTMGFGLPAAIGAKLGRPEATVVAIEGDGSFLMNIQELATAVRYKIGLVAVVVNNGYLGMVRQWQDMFMDGRRSQTELSQPPYNEVAKAFGGMGRRVDRREDLPGALAWAVEQARKFSLPVVLDVIVDPDSRVLPMVPPGGANADFIPCETEVCR